MNLSDIWLQAEAARRPFVELAIRVQATARPTLLIDGQSVTVLDDGLTDDARAVLEHCAKSCAEINERAYRETLRESFREMLGD